MGGVGAVDDMAGNAMCREGEGLGQADKPATDDDNVRVLCHARAYGAFISRVQRRILPVTLDGESADSEKAVLTL